MLKTMQRCAEITADALRKRVRFRSPDKERSTSELMQVAEILIGNLSN